MSGRSGDRTTAVTVCFWIRNFSANPPRWQRWKQARFYRQKKYRLLSRIVRLAWEKCPGYRDHWKSHGWHPSNLRTLEDADDIPIIAKETIRSNVDQFTVTGGNPLFDFTTSGTTGAPFSFKYTSLLNAAHLSAVAIAASYGDGSKQPWQQKALIVKRSVRGASATGAGGGLLINASAVKDASLLRQLVEAYKPTLLFGWPSYVGDISAALRGDYEFRIAILGSENIFEAQVLEAGDIAKVVVGTYGLSEGSGFAMRCHGCGAYAELDTHGLLSLHRRPDGLFDIIGTSFWSRGTLFIRYNNADVTHGPIERCPTCPPNGTLYFKAPSGRSQEFVEDRQGARHALAMIVGAERIVRFLRGIELFDFVQAAPGRLLFRYVTENRRPIDELALVDEFQKIVGEEFVVECRYDARILDLRDARGPGQKWKILKPADFDT
jgi:phenylacetate-coenzyme A ligase PaaK-like adenylate-forming protein